MDAAAQQRLIDNLVGAMQGVPHEIQERQLVHFLKAVPSDVAGVARGLGISTVAAA